MHSWARAAAALAGLTGAAGTGLAAIGAHLAPGTGVRAAAHLMIINAAAALAASALAPSAPGRASWLASATFVLLSGGWLFCGDITLRALAGFGLFPFAAPLGGSLLFCGWIVTAVAAVIALRPPPRKKY
ncbi:MAG: DUF423 domain-containing protein [Methylocapsa sp.]|nr:DUF423 domain-containing protein [Methylocapsa sp.]